MKENEAVSRLAAAMKRRDEDRIERTRQSLGELATVEPIEINYTLKAQELLNQQLTHIAFCNVMNELNLYGYEPVSVQAEEDGSRSYAAPPLPGTPQPYRR